MKAVRIVVRGAVQGVGFRPFVYRLAREMGLRGTVSNSVRGVEIAVEGDGLEEFVERLKSEAPACATVREASVTEAQASGSEGFEIVASEEVGEQVGEVLPDLATCPACLAEVCDPDDRRYLYPFTNCTHCGPRYSIVEALPYDRCNTTMACFTMCPACQAEYDDPGDRRFHAQPNACPECGPRVWFGEEQGSGAIVRSAELVRHGRVLALKGVGGFHLVTDARSDEAVSRLRERKQRGAKPLAVMFPSMEELEDACEVSEQERNLLQNPAAPIVLVRRRSSCGLSGELAPGNPWLGAFLPYSPLHHIWMRLAGVPVVMTSGNLSDEPICIDNAEAMERLGKIADGFLMHDRDIERPVDDSVVRVMAGREMVMRRSRGYAPAPVEIGADMTPVLALGGDLKNTVCVASGDRAFLSQHHGDLETAASHETFLKHLDDLPELSRIVPELVAADEHPGYHSSRAVERFALPVVGVQHHHAHIAACLAENGVREEVLGVSWDGTGYGRDATIWGGEFLRATQTEFERVAHLRTFRLPGGERAVREPRRVALGLLHELGIDPSETRLAEVFSPEELRTAGTMLEQGINSPVTSSAGRLFDGIAGLLGIRDRNEYEGQAAMELEFAVTEAEGGYPAAGEIGDWEPIVRGVLDDLRNGLPKGVIAAKFHHAMVEVIVNAARQTGLQKVALSGGCFQNRTLTEGAVRHLREEGFEPLWHRRVPPNDGGLALGQAVVAGQMKLNKTTTCA
jgi:hydrogenase maturation protein HypF